MCFRLACAGFVFGCRLSVSLRCVWWAYSDFGALASDQPMLAVVATAGRSSRRAWAGHGYSWLASTAVFGPLLSPFARFILAFLNIDDCTIFCDFHAVQSSMLVSKYLIF